MNNKIWKQTILGLAIYFVCMVLAGCRYYGYISPTRDANTVIIEKRLKEKQKFVLAQEQIKNEEEIARRTEKQTREENSNNRIREDLDYYFR